MKIKKLAYILAVTALVLSTSSCDKFLNVTPIDALSGNNFWETKKDVEGYTNGIYLRLKTKIGNTALLPSLEIRGNWIGSSSGPITYINLIYNNLKGIIGGGDDFDGVIRENMSWKGWYDVIAASNILHAEVGNMPESIISASEKKRYQAEAVFTRNLSYMYICKMFGDAIYYTDAYNSKPLPRLPQLEVLKKCIADMNSAKDNLPVKYPEASLLGLRPTRASAVALLMHLNMWAAAWDTADKSVYYKAVTALGEELKTYTDYRLLPITVENTKRIFKGRSSENLFSILQDYNYGETFADYANSSYFFSHYPYRGTVTTTTSRMAYQGNYLEKLYPAGIADQRRALWFDNVSENSLTFQFKKFINTYARGSGSGVTMVSDDSAIIFRLSDAILLVAEAHAELGQETEAKAFLNQIRLNAGASEITTGGETLKDDIFKERCRELIGEGQYYFDLVRTKRVVNSEFANSPMSVGNFNNGAWTWPLIITAEERNANPGLIGNNFWN